MATTLRLVRHLKWLSVFVAIAVLAACGGGGSGRACVSDPSRDSRLPGCDATVPEVTASSVQLLVSSQQLNSDGLSTVAITVIAVDANRQALANRPVEISAADPANSAVVANFTQPANKTAASTRVTDVNGQLAATLSPGASKANRTITLTATVDGASATNSVTVVGTTLAIKGSNALALGASAPLSLSLADSSGTPIGGVSVAVASANGNGVAPATVVTDASGQATVVVTGTKAGSDTISASAIGANTAYALAVSSQGFAFTSPAPGTTQQVPTGMPLLLSVRWTDGGAAVAGQVVGFATTRGTLAASAVATDASGNARTTVSSASPGPAAITASAPGGGGAFATINVMFVGNNVPRTVNLQADRTTIAVNAPGSTANYATLTAVVRDASGYFASGVTVNFHIDQDPTGGMLAAASAITDVNGVARTTYVPSTLSSPTNGVVISATALDRFGAVAATSNPLQLTIGGQKLFVRIGTDRFVEKLDANYTKKYSAFVTDAAGNPVPNAAVQFLFRPAQEVAFDPALWTPQQYFNRDQSGYFSPPGSTTTYDYAYLKGYWTPSGEQVITTGCFNEDYNFNGVIDPVKDYNGNGKLDPGNVFSVNQSATTNSSGYATGTITYPQAWALWIRVTLKVTAQVAGTEAYDSVTFIPTYAAGDNLPGIIDAEGGAPVTIVLKSPFGKASRCNDPS